jgi:hypothetical protein
MEPQMTQSDNSDVSEALIAEVADEVAAGHSPILDALFRGEGLAQPEMIWDPPPQSLPDPRLKEIERIWRALPMPQGIPPAQAVDPLNFIGALGIVMLLDVLAGGQDYRYRVYGADVAGGFGQSMLGRRTSEIPMPAPVRALFLGGYRAVLTQGKPLYTCHPAPPGVPVAHWCRLILPLADEAGAVSRLLVGNVPGPRRERPV